MKMFCLLDTLIRFSTAYILRRMSFRTPLVTVLILVEFSPSVGYVLASMIFYISVSVFRIPANLCDNHTGKATLANNLNHLGR